MSLAEQRGELRRLINGYQLSQALHVVATLGIADLLAHGDDSVEHLATAVRADEQSLYRLLRALAAVGIFVETPTPPTSVSRYRVDNCGPKAAIGRPL